MNVKQWYFREMGVYSSLRDFIFVFTQTDSKKCNRIAMHALYRPNGQIDRLSSIHAFIVLIADDIHNACAAHTHITIVSVNSTLGIFFIYICVCILVN